MRQLVQEARGVRTDSIRTLRGLRIGLGVQYQFARMCIKVQDDMRNLQRDLHVKQMERNEQLAREHEARIDKELKGLGSTLPTSLKNIETKQRHYHDENRKDSLKIVDILQTLERSLKTNVEESVSNMENRMSLAFNEHFRRIDDIVGRLSSTQRTLTDTSQELRREQDQKFEALRTQVAAVYNALADPASIPEPYAGVYCQGEEEDNADDLVKLLHGDAGTMDSFIAEAHSKIQRMERTLDLERVVSAGPQTGQSQVAVQPATSEHVQQQPQSGTGRKKKAAAPRGGSLQQGPVSVPKKHFEPLPYETAFLAGSSLETQKQLFESHSALERAQKRFEGAEQISPEYRQKQEERAQALVARNKNPGQLRKSIVNSFAVLVDQGIVVQVAGSEMSQIVLPGSGEVRGPFYFKTLVSLLLQAWCEHEMPSINEWKDQVVGAFLDLFGTKFCEETGRLLVSNFYNSRVNCLHTEVKEGGKLSYKSPRAPRKKTGGANSAGADDDNSEDEGGEDDGEDEDAE
jgi:hypothetical protein